MPLFYCPPFNKTGGIHIFICFLFAGELETICSACLPEQENEFKPFLFSCQICCDRDLIQDKNKQFYEREHGTITNISNQQFWLVTSARCMTYSACLWLALFPFLPIEVSIKTVTCHSLMLPSNRQKTVSTQSSHFNVDDMLWSISL